MTTLRTLKMLLCAAGAAAASVSHAGLVPAGLQSNVSAATVASWGWTECHRSSTSTAVAAASILGSCTGSHLMMGHSRIVGLYDILGAGSYATVTAITYANAQSDNGGTTLNNWSNGLNFYRTAASGAWGFTTNHKTDLNTADIMLSNGLQAFNGQAEGVLSAGLSFHLNSSGNLSSGWGYTVTGSDFTGMNGSRVFLQYTESQVAEPGAFLLFGIGLLGLGIARWRR